MVGVCVMRRIILSVSLALLIVLVLACNKTGQESAAALGGAAVVTPTNDIDSDIQRLEEQLRKQKENPVAASNDTETDTSENTAVLSDDGDVKKIRVTEEDLVNLSVSADDPDGDTLRATFTSPLSPEGIWQTKIGDEGEYDVLATVSDGANSVTQKIKLIVIRKVVAPVITLSDLAVQEGDLVTLNVDLAFRGDEEVELSYSEPFTSEGTWQTNSKSEGVYNITVTAKAGSFKSEKTIIVTVKDLNRAPVITGFVSEVRVKEGENVTIAAEVSDDIIKKAMRFRLRNRTKDLSYVDAVGYVLSMEKNVKFVTGDQQFKGMENVELVR